MGWKIILVAVLVGLWAIWPAIRIPKDNYIRRKLGALGAYLLLILGLLAILQILERFIARAN